MLGEYLVCYDGNNDMIIHRIMSCNLNHEALQLEHQGGLRLLGL